MAIKIKGTAELAAHCREAQRLENVKRVVAHHSAQLDNAMKRQTKIAFVKGYTNGDTARSIMTVISDGGLTTTTKPTTNYSVYLEYGTRFMNAEPFVHPALNQIKPLFLKDIETVMK